MNNTKFKKINKENVLKDLPFNSVEIISSKEPGLGQPRLRSGVNTN